MVHFFFFSRLVLCLFVVLVPSPFLFLYDVFSSLLCVLHRNFYLEVVALKFVSYCKSFCSNCDPNFCSFSSPGISPLFTAFVFANFIRITIELECLTISSVVIYIFCFLMTCAVQQNARTALINP